MHAIEETFVARATEAMESRIPEMKLLLDDAADYHVSLRTKATDVGGEEKRALFDLEYMLFKDSLQYDDHKISYVVLKDMPRSVPSLLDCGRKISATFLEYIDFLAAKARKVFAMHFRYELRPSDGEVSPVALKEYMASVEKMADSERELMKATLKKDLMDMCARYLPFLNLFLSGDCV